MVGSERATRKVSTRAPCLISPSTYVDDVEAQRRRLRIRVALRAPRIAAATAIAAASVRATRIERAPRTRTDVLALYPEPRHRSAHRAGRSVATREAHSKAAKNGRV